MQAHPSALRLAFYPEQVSAACLQERQLEPQLAFLFKPTQQEAVGAIPRPKARMLQLALGRSRASNVGQHQKSKGDENKLIPSL